MAFCSKTKVALLLLHYRQAPNLEETIRLRLARLVSAALPAFDCSMAIMSSRSSRLSTTNRRPSKLHAGRAVQRRTPVFIGDDTTDLDGFAAMKRLDGLAIAVGWRIPGESRLAASARCTRVAGKPSGLLMDSGDRCAGACVKIPWKKTSTRCHSSKLLMMGETPDRRWLIADVASRNYITEQRASDTLNALLRRGLVSLEKSPPRFSLQSRDGRNLRSGGGPCSVLPEKPVAYHRAHSCKALCVDKGIRACIRPEEGSIR